MTQMKEEEKGDTGDPGRPRHLRPTPRACRVDCGWMLNSRHVERSILVGKGQRQLRVRARKCSAKAKNEWAIHRLKIPEVKLPPSIFRVRAEGRHKGKYALYRIYTK